MSEGLQLSEAGLVASGLLTNTWEPATREELLAALMHHDRILEDLARLMRHAAYVHRMYGRRITLERLMAVAASVVCEQLLLLAERFASPMADGPRAVRTQVMKAYEDLSAPGRDAEMASKAWAAQESRRRPGQAQEPQAGRQQLTAREREVDFLAWAIATRHRRYNATSPSDRQKAEKAVAQRTERKRPPPPPPPRADPRPPPPARR